MIAKPMPRLYTAIRVTTDPRGGLQGERLAGPLLINALLKWVDHHAPAFTIRMSMSNRTPFVLFDELRDIDPAPTHRN